MENRLTKKIGLRLLKAIPPNYAINTENAEKVCSIARYFEDLNDAWDYDIDMNLIASSDLFPCDVSLMIIAETLVFKNTIEFAKMLAENADFAAFEPLESGEDYDGEVLLSIEVNDVFYFASNDENEIAEEKERLKQNSDEIAEIMLEAATFFEDETEE